jgi:hypothetical protein
MTMFKILVRIIPLIMFFEFSALCLDSVAEISYSEISEMKSSEMTDMRGDEEGIFLVTKNHYAQDLNHGYSTSADDLIMLEILSGKSRTRDLFNDKEYKLYSGGEYKGNVKVKSLIPFFCDSEAALITVPPTLKIEDDQFLIATNSKKVKTHKVLPSLPSQNEKATAIKIVSEQFRKNGIEIDNKSIFNLDHLVVTFLGEGQPKILIGTVSLKKKKHLDEVFMIVELKSENDRAGFIKYRHTENAEGIADIAIEKIVGQLDLDGDGTDEIITVTGGSSAEKFRIYKKKFGGTWKETGVLGYEDCD